ncbi:MAG TPA: TonB-dependent receptor [Rhizomicrobium sp.]|nr:TonB-dependent receptor [Rhizomicrobium sp.]
MRKLQYLKSALVGGASLLALAGAASADEFNIPAGDLKTALDHYAAQTGLNLIVSDDAVRGAHTTGAKGDFTASIALTRILQGTGLSPRRTTYGAVAIVHTPAERSTARIVDAEPLRVAAAATAAIESVVVTSSKIKGDIQTVPIAITALSQEQLTSRQIAGGPDLVKEVPNLTFSKTNFTGYNIQIRGIGTQAISVTTDPAVAVAFNDTPFIRNHFFEQEFYDVSQVEVLRGPQGTLYGRNATAGVVNVISAKPTDQFEAMASADVGNYHNRRFEGMVNIPIVDDRLDVRAAAEWTKRDGYSFNELTNAPIDGRDLWSSRVTLGLKPTSNLQANLIWEHFSENDDRMRTAKQLCKTDYLPTILDGIQFNIPQNGGESDYARALSQGCSPVSLYSPDALQVPFSWALPIFSAAEIAGVLNTQFAPYSSTTQSRNLRVIEASINPIYKAKNDTIELNADYQITPALTFSSDTGYNHDFLWSTEDYNRFNSPPGAFNNGDESSFAGVTIPDPAAGTNGIAPYSAVFCDPQLGCSDRVVTQDLSDERAWQLSQEFRLSSNFQGPFNFSLGGNYLHYETEENYYVFANTLTIFALQNYDSPAFNCIHYGCTAAQLAAAGIPYVPGVSDNHQCFPNGSGFAYQNPNAANFVNNADGACPYVDPNPIGNLNNEGHNYFLSQNPYTLNSYAGFGEAYYNVASDLKLTAGLRWTNDRKHFLDIPSEVGVTGYGYPITGIVNQQWNQWTGRGAVNWTPKLDFTDQTLVYGSFAHGYKAGGANPPGAIFLQAVLDNSAAVVSVAHPATFKPEFIDAYELGTKNTLMDGALTLNGDIFFYNYKGYQISEIVDRTAINNNFDATVRGAELESSWEPVPGLKLNFAGGYEGTRIDNGQSAIDLMDRTAGHPGWVVAKRFPTNASNCVLPAYVFPAAIDYSATFLDTMCDYAYDAHVDPVTRVAFTPYPDVGPARQFPFPPYPGFDPLAGTPGDPYAGQNIDPVTGVDLGPAPNNGDGFAKDLSGNQLPNAPHFTASFSAEYTMPVSEDWAATLHSDFYWQSQSFARVFNDRPYDKIRGYSNVNLALILTSADGWQVMGYLKNVFNTTAITGDFLNSDDSGLTTNVFLTDPRLFGVRVTKNF